MENNLVGNLINAMVEYGVKNKWNDNDIIDKLIDCGITQEDFIDNGYEQEVKEYFEDMDFNKSKYNLGDKVYYMSVSKTKDVGTINKIEKTNDGSRYLYALTTSQYLRNEEEILGLYE